MNAKPAFRLSIIALSALIYLGCAQNEPKKNHPGEPTEVIGVDMSRASEMRFETTPRATLSGSCASANVTRDESIDFTLPIRFNTTTGVAKTLNIRFNGRNPGGRIVAQPIRNCSAKQVRFRGVAVAVNDDSVSEAITLMVTQSLEFEVACLGTITGSGREACFELVLSQFTKQAGTNASLVANDYKVFHFVQDYNPATSESGLILNVESTNEMGSLNIRGRDAAIEHLL